MCGRYSFIADEEQLKQQFQPIEIASTIPRSYNIAPTQLAPVITNAAPALLQPMNPLKKALRLSYGNLPR